jgi:NADH:ubiquinone oxidoreductase subunit 6 (subunit J)
MVVADYALGDALLTVLSIFVFVGWIMVLFTIIGDLFRDHAMSGFGKAVWVFFLVFLPFITGLIYLIARGGGMRDRAIAAQKEAKAEFDDYVRTTAGGGSGVDELARLSELHDKGKLTDAEFASMKAKVLG